MEELNRKVTSREIYERKYVPIHKTCIEIARKELEELGVKYELSDWLSLAKDHFIYWMKNLQAIENEKTKANRKG